MEMKWYVHAPCEYSLCSFYLNLNVISSQAEYDGMLVEYAGSIIGPLASVVGGEAFFPWLQFLIPPLMTKLVSNQCLYSHSSNGSLLGLAL